MNIVIKNQNFRILDSLNIEIIKTLTGEYTFEEVEQSLINMYYNKAIIDITAIRNYYDINSVITFLRGFDPTKIIILLNDSEVINSSSFLGRFVENGIYNFTRNAAGINYLLDHPNNYEHVKQYVNSSSGWNLNPTFNANYNVAPNTYGPNLASAFEKEPVNNDVNRRQLIIGLQNLTEHAGSTTLAYMMIKQLKFNYLVKGIEMNKQDFIYFHDNDLSLCTSIDDLKLKLREHALVDAIIIDLNDFDATAICDEILYLADPGRIRLNKLFKKDSNAHMKVKNGKVILNRSSIKEEEITNLEYETKFSIFFNMPNFDDRKERIQIVDSLLYNLGFTKQGTDSKGLFGSILK